MRRVLVVISLFVLIVLAGCARTDGQMTSISAQVVEMTPDGFVPKSLTIPVGTAVTFVNKDTVERWPASARHPTHTVYPGSDIQKCGTSEEPKLFDACRGILPGSTFTFTFNEKGSWNYHDHVNPRMFGTVVAE